MRIVEWLPWLIIIHSRSLARSHTTRAHLSIAMKIHLQKRGDCWLGVLFTRRTRQENQRLRPPLFPPVRARALLCISFIYLPALRFYDAAEINFSQSPPPPRLMIYLWGPTRDWKLQNRDRVPALSGKDARRREQVGPCESKSLHTVNLLLAKL